MAWTKEKQAARQARRLARRKAEAAARGEEYDPKVERAHGRYVKLNFGDSDEVAAGLVEAADPFHNLENAAKAAGLPPQILRSLKMRLAAKFRPVADEIREYSTKHFLTNIEDRLGRALVYLDDYALSGATAKDLAVIIGILTEKRQLLRGEPTAILTMEERTSLNILIPVVIREAARRGITIDMDSEEVRMLGGRGVRGEIPL